MELLSDITLASENLGKYYLSFISSNRQLSADIKIKIIRLKPVILASRHRSNKTGISNVILLTFVENWL